MEENINCKYAFLMFPERVDYSAAAERIALRYALPSRVARAFRISLERMRLLTLSFVRLFSSLLFYIRIEIGIHALFAPDKHFVVHTN